jgi:uncharacterized protein (TIGR02246 family)
MNVQTESETASAEIAALIERCAQAFRDKDVDAVMACHTDDVVVFDCHSQFEAKGAPAVRAFLEACMPHMRGPIVNEVHELSIDAGREVAVAHYHMRTSCCDTEGAEHGGWLRVTLGLRRTAGRWLAGHAHISAPFNPMTNQTMFGLARDAHAFADASQGGAGCLAS